MNELADAPKGNVKKLAAGHSIDEREVITLGIKVDDEKVSELYDLTPKKSIPDALRHLASRGRDDILAEWGRVTNITYLGDGDFSINVNSKQNWGTDYEMKRGHNTSFTINYSDPNFPFSGISLVEGDADLAQFGIEGEGDGDLEGALEAYKALSADKRREFLRLMGDS